jgi:DNA-binding XRE family transcriptional regulator
MENAAGWARLAKEVLLRRHVLGVSQEELARRGGPSHQSIRNIEAGSQNGYRELTLARLERVLGWRPGTVQAILNGDAGDDPDEWVTQHHVRHVTDSAPAVDTVVATTQLRGQSRAGSFGRSVSDLSADDTVAGGTVFEGAPLVTRAGLDFLDLVHQYYGADQESAKVQRAVLGFIRHILNDEAVGTD